MRVQVTALLILLNLLTLVTGVYGYDKGLSQSALGDKPTLTISNAKATINKELSLSPLNYDSKGFTEYTKDSTISYKSKTIEYRINDKSGGFEYDTIFYSKPASNLVNFLIEGDFQFEKQEALDTYVHFYDYPVVVNATHVIRKSDSAILFHRPIDIIDSFAVYDNEFKKYQIYRCFVTDAKGVKTWCDMDIKENILTVTIPQFVLDKGAYPLVLDPNIGYETLGSSTRYLDSGYWDGDYDPPELVRDCFIKGSNYTLPKNIEITKMRIGVKNMQYQIRKTYFKGGLYCNFSTSYLTWNTVTFQSLQSEVDLTYPDKVWVDVYFEDNPIILGESNTLFAAYAGGAWDEPHDYSNNYQCWICCDTYTTKPTYQIDSHYPNIWYDYTENGGKGSDFYDRKVSDLNLRYSLYVEYQDYTPPIPDEGGLSYSHLLLGSTLFLPFILLIVSEQLREQY